LGLWHSYCCNFNWFIDSSHCCVNSMGKDRALRSGGKILVVEDDLSIRGLLRRQLEMEGYAVEEAHDGKEGIELVARFKPDLILLDLMMPEMDGFEFLRKLRDQRDSRAIPVIVLTAKGTSEDKLEGLRDGANDYLTKPYGREELLLRVNNLLEWGRMQREANPLTGFPGNLSIEQEVRRRIEKKERFAFIYIDIDNFKAFNDRYGYQRGDEAIKLLASIIMRKTEQLGEEGDFVGHIGGDDFVVVCSVEKAVAVSKSIIAEFDSRVKELLDEEDLQKGYLEVVNRRGVPERFSFMTLTVALVRSDKGNLKHFRRMSDIASELKRYGKTFEKSVLVEERRLDDQKAEEKDCTAFPGSYS